MSESELKTSRSKSHAKPAHKIPLFGREFHMPRSRWMRVAIGVGLVVLGIFGFLPILGFWMIPLGLLVLSYEFHTVRRQRRRFIVWRERRKRKV
jgi:purine-cytosine permease-like protein